MEGNREQATGNSKINSYKDLKVWQKGMDICAMAYEVTAEFPKEERYGLTAQIRDAATSIPSNVAEGYGRESSGSYAQFLKIARGSLFELETRILLSVRLGLVSHASVEHILSETDQEKLMLSRLITKIEGFTS